MGLATRYLAAGFTQADYRAALLSAATEAWGAPSYYTPNAVRPYGYQYLEWPNFNGRKHVWDGNAANTLAQKLATSVQYSGMSAGYLNLSAGANISMPPTTSGACYIVVIDDAGFRALALYFPGVVGYFRSVALLRAPVFWWGAADRVYRMDDAFNVYFLAGVNPWGSLNPTTGQASVPGQINMRVNQPADTGQANTILGKRQLRLNEGLSSNEGAIGVLPEKLAWPSISGLTGTTPQMFDAGADGLYLLLPNGSTLGLAYKVDAVPFPGLTTHPAFVYDLANVIGVTLPPEEGECEPVRRTVGQIWPNPNGLEVFSQGGEGSP